MSRLRLSSLFEFLEETAIVDAEQNGFGIWKMRELGYTYAISRMKLRVNHVPRWGETLTVRTWTKNFFAHKVAIKDYSVFDGSGKAIAQATSSWLLVNLRTGRSEDPENAPFLPDLFPEENALPETLVADNLPGAGSLRNIGESGALRGFPPPCLHLRRERGGSVRGAFPDAHRLFRRRLKPYSFSVIPFPAERPFRVRPVNLYGVTEHCRQLFKRAAGRVPVGVPFPHGNRGLRGREACKKRERGTRRGTVMPRLQKICAEPWRVGEQFRFFFPGKVRREQGGKCSVRHLQYDARRVLSEFFIVRRPQDAELPAAEAPFPGPFRDGRDRSATVRKGEYAVPYPGACGVRPVEKGVDGGTARAPVQKPSGVVPVPVAHERPVEPLYSARAKTVRYSRGIRPCVEQGVAFPLREQHGESLAHIEHFHRERLRVGLRFAPAAGERRRGHRRHYKFHQKMKHASPPASPFCLTFHDIARRPADPATHSLKRTNRRLPCKTFAKFAKTSFFAKFTSTISGVLCSYRNTRKRSASSSKSARNRAAAANSGAILSPSTANSTATSSSVRSRKRMWRTSNRRTSSSAIITRK